MGLKHIKTTGFQVTSRLGGKNSCFLVPSRFVFSLRFPRPTLLPARAVEPTIQNVLERGQDPEPKRGLWERICAKLIPGF